jgi:diaminopimelate decarboxylase
MLRPTAASMNDFQYRGGVLCAEEVPLTRIAKAVGTPTYVYSTATLERHFRILTQSLGGVPHLLCYSVKASSNVSLLRLLAGLGSGFDIVSGGELSRSLRAGADPAKVVFSGVGKTDPEMEMAIKAKILLFNVESAEELEALNAVGVRLKRPAPFAIRVNPDVDARTHRHIATGLKTSKFGVPFADAAQLYQRSRRMKGVVARGVDCHIGSQLTQLAPLERAVTKVAQLYRELSAAGFALELIDVGGGLGIRYTDESPPSPAQYSAVVRKAIRGTGARLILEPGRVISGNAAVLLTRVLYRKRGRPKTFVIVDAGMNDLIRPALYDAHHELQPVLRRSGPSLPVDVVGPVCESSDVLARDRKMVLPERGDLFAVRGAGAYGMSMASNYNSRPLPAEVLVAKNRFRIIRERETLEDLVAGEI